MVVVEHLHEWLDAATLGRPFLSHLPGDLQRVSFDPSDECVPVRLIGASLIVVLDDHRLPASIASAQDKYDFARFYEFPHRSEEFLAKERTRAS